MRDVGTLPRISVREPRSSTHIADQLATHGIGLFSGSQGSGDLVRLARSLMTVRTHRDSDAEGITIITPRRRVGPVTSVVGFTDRELHPHTEGSAVEQPCRLLMLACDLPAATGGLVRLVDGSDVYQEIAERDPAMLNALSTARSAYFGSGSGHLGAVFEVSRGGRVRIRLRLDELVRFAPSLERYVDKLRAIVREHTQEICMRGGEGYVLANDRWMHGRTRFTGTRRMLRIIGDPLPYKPVRTGFDAAARPEPVRI
jgi:hypothetical protein